MAFEYIGEIFYAVCGRSKSGVSLGHQPEKGYPPNSKTIYPEILHQSLIFESRQCVQTASYLVGAICSPLFNRSHTLYVILEGVILPALPVEEALSATTVLKLMRFIHPIKVEYDNLQCLYAKKV